MNLLENVAAVLKRMNEGILLFKHGKINLAAKKYEKVDQSVFSNDDFQVPSLLWRFCFSLGRCHSKTYIFEIL